MAGGAWKASERLVARKLGEWWAGNEDAFKRAPVSGGWPKKRSHGDIVANNDIDVPEGVRNLANMFVTTWSMDVKRRIQGSSGKWHLEQLLTAGKHPILKWWKEITELALHRGTMRMLIISKAERQYCMVFGEREIEYLRGCVETSLGGGLARRLSHYIGPSLVFSGVPGVEDLTFVDMGVFLNRVPARILGGINRDGCRTEAERTAKERIRKASAQDSVEG